MIQIKCPNCNTILEVSNNKTQTACPKCINDFGKHFIMLETEDCKFKNLGDGLFKKVKE